MSDNNKDVNKDGIEDGSPESIEKVAKDFGNMLGVFFSGVLDEFSKYKESIKPKKEVNKEENSDDEGPQVLKE